MVRTLNHDCTEVRYIRFSGWKGLPQGQYPPPRGGYWAKLKAGKKCHKTLLPPRFPGESNTIYIGRYSGLTKKDKEILEEIPQPSIFDEEVETMRERVIKMVGKVAYLQIKTKTHPLIQTLLSQDETRKLEHAKNPFDWNKSIYDSPIERRRLRILNALFLAAMSFGCNASISNSTYDQKNCAASIKVDSQRVEFTLKKVVQNRQRNSTTNTKKQKPCLSISVDKNMTTLLHYWEDTEDTGLESHLTLILIEILMIAELHHRNMEQMHYEWNVRKREELIETRRQQILENERRALEEIERIKKEKFDKLISEAISLQQAESIRRHVSAARVNSASQNKKLEPISKIDFRN